MQIKATEKKKTKMTLLLCKSVVKPLGDMVGLYKFRCIVQISS